MARQEKMKAAVLHGIGDMRFEEVDIPKLAPHEILIRVKYVGICGSDLPRAMVSGLTGNTAYPLILGHEFSGQIAEFGEAVKQESTWQIGDRVTVAPLIPCGVCEHCKSGDYGLCNSYKIIGTRIDGAMAEFVKAPASHVLRLPDGLDYQTAAGIEPATIAFHGIEKAEIHPGDSVAILGAGPIGQFAIQWAKIFGASKIFAVDIFDDKLAIAKRLGATHVINGKFTDSVAEIRQHTKLGVDAVLETAGSHFTQEEALLMAKKHGHIAFVGISHGDLPLKAASAERILRGELTVRGSWNSYTAPYPGRAWMATIDFMAKGDLIFEPMISHVIHLQDVGHYLQKMAKHEISFNKVLVQVDEMEDEA